MASTITFGQDGRRVLMMAAESVVVLNHPDGETIRIPAHAPRGIAGFTDQIWIVDGEVPSLRRVDDCGRSIAAPYPLEADPHAVLSTIGIGPPAVTWGRRAIYDDLGTLREHPAPHADHAFPLTARRWLTVKGGRVDLGNGIVITSPVRRLVHAEVVADGSAVVLVGEAARYVELVMVVRASGAIQSSLRLPLVTSGAVRFAARRAIAAVCTEPRRVEIVDLRSGRRLGTIETDGDVHELALDGDARSIALRYGEALVEVLGVEAAIRRTPVVDVPVTVEKDPMVRAVIVAPSTTASTLPVPAPLLRPFVLHALHPRVVAQVDPAGARAALARELRLVELRTLLAICEAWDTRRIGYADESAHPFEHEVAALVGMNRGFAAAHVASATAQLATYERELLVDPHHRSRSSAIGALQHELGLSAVAVDLLLAVAAPALRGETARLYGILANDPHRPLVDEQLLVTLFGAAIDRHALQRELDIGAPLARTGALRCGDRPRPFAPLSVDPVILARLAGALPDMPERIAMRATAPALEDLELPGAGIAHAIAQLGRPTAAPARLVIRGRHGAGLRTLAASLAREVHRPLAVIDAARLASEPDQFRTALATTLRQAHLAGGLPCVIHLERVPCEDRRNRDAIGEVLGAHVGPVVVCLPPDTQVPFSPGHVVLAVPAPTEAERAAAWTTALAGTLSVHDVAGLAARYRIGVAAIRRAVAGVVAAHPTGLPEDATEVLEAFLRQDRELRIGEYARRVGRLATWSSLVLPSDVLDSLRELIGRVRHRRQVFETWGMGRTLSTSRGLTAMFSGQPGTGKTMVAGVIARELGLDLYQVDLSKVVSRWIGETERNLGAIFDAAEEGQCVLLFDEADSLFAKRTEVKSSNDRYANLEVNYLLQRLDAFEGIAILTTNFSGSIDPAFKRRISFKLSFPFPDEETREQLWRVHLPPELPVAGELDLAALSRKYQLAGGYIRNACLRAAFLAAQAEDVITQAFLERAVTLEFAELGKLSSTGALD
jgi:ATPase family associated with various cellular activities (AAA)